MTKNKPDATLTLSCVPDVSPCSSNIGARGLCCGCRNNEDCDPDSKPVTQGCGMDTCCRARPRVVGTTPAHAATGVCTNADIIVSFDQKMDAASFKDNFILIEEKELGAECPAGTTKIGAVSRTWENKNIIVKSFYKLWEAARQHLTWIFGRGSLADNISYCSIPGAVFSAPEGDNKTILTFQPSIVLNADTVYYAVAKGVADLSTTTGAVLNYWGIGLNVGDSGSPVSNGISFNGSSFQNSYIWSFRTKQSNGEDDGICAIARASIFPDSYLIHVMSNDLNENDDNPGAKTFDTADDVDKAFLASVYSGDDQLLHPVSGYSWIWNWQNSNSNAARIINNENGADKPYAAASSSQLVRAVAGVVDDKTQLLAKVSLTDFKIFTDMNVAAPGRNASSTADVYVFICTTTWPNKQADGTWRPWRDTLDAVLGGGCMKAPNSPNSVCSPMNYELYYCRDTKNAAQKLPEVKSPVTSLGSNLGCTDAKGSCDGKSVGDPCGNSGGICQDLLKESYFFGQ
ncbi:MAG: Ig-like domain-containing protein [Patescibacteria group bacterium]|nr:Ig-like domain-containing protein [Patescibacteria group bacterium]